MVNRSEFTPSFSLARKNSTPNHANVTVKQIATATRPNPACPAWYFPYSFTVAPAKTQRHEKENNPRNLQPQLMQHPSECLRRRRRGVGRCPHRPAALGLRGRYPRHHP